MATEPESEPYEERQPNQVTTIGEMSIGHTTMSRLVLLDIPGKGVLAFPVKSAKFLVEQFTKEIELLEKS